MRLHPAPSYIILKPYTLKNKHGNFEIPETDTEDKPELGQVIEVGPEGNKVPYAKEYIPKVGDIVGFKKFNVFTLTLGTQKFIAVHLENILFTLDETNE